MAPKLREFALEFADLQLAFMPTSKKTAGGTPARLHG